MTSSLTFLLYILCAFEPLCLCVKNVLPLHFRRIVPIHPLQRHPNMHAAATREPSAALLQIQRHQPNHPLRKNVNSAASPVLPACHFGVKWALKMSIVSFVPNNG
jgi:hypothetical protein